MQKNISQEFDKGVGSAKISKQARREKLLDYLANPENQWIDRQTQAVDILGYRNAQSIWNAFSSTELNEIEQEALAERRKRCATISAKVDQVLLEKALAGDVKAIRLFYQRYENWSERQILDHRGDSLPVIKIGAYYHSE